MTLFDRFDLISALSIGIQQKAILYRLLCYCGDQNEGFPGLDRLAKDVSLSRRRVMVYMEELREAGYLKTIRRRRQSSVYSIDWDAIRGPQDAPSPTHLNQSRSAVRGTSRMGLDVPSTVSKKCRVRHPEHKGNKANLFEKTDVPKRRAPRTQKSKRLVVTDQEMKSLPRGLERFPDFVAAGHFKDSHTDRHKFMAWWRYLSAHRTNPVAALFACITADDRTAGSDENDDAVSAFLREHDSAHRGPVVDVVKRTVEAMRPSEDELEAQYLEDQYDLDEPLEVCPW